MIRDTTDRAPVEEYRGYKIVPEGSFAMYLVKNTGSGPAPKALQGYFLSVNEARKAINGHINTKKKGVADGASKGSDQD